MTKTSFAEGQLKALVERIERLEEEKKTIAADIKEVYAEAKSNGFDVTIMRKVVALRRKDPEDRSEEEAMLDLYMAALRMQPSLFDGKTQTTLIHQPVSVPPVEAAVETGEVAHTASPVQIEEHTSSLLSAGVGGRLTNENETGDLAAGSVDIAPSKSPGPADQSLPNEIAYEASLALVRSQGYASMLLLQNDLALPYHVAAIQIERMEREGIITAPQANGKRSVIEPKPEPDLPAIPEFMDRRKCKSPYTPEQLLASG